MATTPKRLLTVDDEPDNCDLIAYILQDFEVVIALSKADALRQVSTGKFDLIILDYYLSDGTGLEICLFIRDFDKNTPILFCTSSSAINEAEAATVGAQGVIKKGGMLQESLEQMVPRLLFTQPAI